MSTTTTNMSLIVPTSGDTDYPTSETTSMTLIDAHDHSSGKGVQIPTGGIADGAVTAVKLGAGSVTAAKIATGVITQVKMGALGQQISSSSGVFNTSSTSAVDVTNLSVTITTTGRPVFIGLIPDGANPAGIELAYGAADVLASGRIDILEDASIIGSSLLSAYLKAGELTAAEYPPGMIFMIRPVSAGTYTYKIQARVSAATYALYVAACKLIAYEL